MADLVNDFCHRFYPEKAVIDDWEMQHLGGGSGRKCNCPRRDTIFPLMECADGFSMSVQGHFGAYCYPRDDFADRYSKVEVYEVSAPEPLLNDQENESRRAFDREPTETAGMDEPAGYVPIAVIEAIVLKHGGLK